MLFKIRALVKQQSKLLVEKGNLDARHYAPSTLCKGKFTANFAFQHGTRSLRTTALIGKVRRWLDLNLSVAERMSRSILSGPDTILS